MRNWLRKLKESISEHRRSLHHRSKIARSQDATQQWDKDVVLWILQVASSKVNVSTRRTWLFSASLSSRSPFCARVILMNIFYSISVTRPPSQKPVKLNNTYWRSRQPRGNKYQSRLKETISCRGRGIGQERLYHLLATSGRHAGQFLKVVYLDLRYNLWI